MRQRARCRSLNTTSKRIMRLRTGAWGPTLDLSIGKQVIAAARPLLCPHFQRKKFRKPMRWFLQSQMRRGRRRKRLIQRLNGLQRSLQPRGLRRRNCCSRLEAVKSVEVSEAIISRQAEEANEETAAPMTVDEPKLHEKSFPVPEVEETVEVVFEPFFE